MALILQFVRKFSSQMLFRPVIGLEVHAQIMSNSKLFSRAGTSFLSSPNTQVSYFDCALPGTLPVVNRRCVEAAILAGLAFNCRINKITRFDRKHYFYADLPAGYQITQYFYPIASSGSIIYHHVTSKSNCEEKSVRIKQIQIEQDSGKSLHDNEETLVDLNRCGMGLLEIVTEPDFYSADEVTSFLKEIQHILCLISVCSGKMEEGALRVDANVSIQRLGSDFKGVRTEVKNLNSIRSVQKAVQYEIQRQMDEVIAGRSINNETRSFDAQKGRTLPLRDKERVFDYRYMAEPNLPALQLFTDDDWPGSPAVNISAVQKLLPTRLPNDIRRDLSERLGLRKDLAARIVGDRCLLSVFEKAIKHRPLLNVTALANFILVEVVGFANANNISDIDSLPAEKIADLVWLRTSDRLSSYSMRVILNECLLSVNETLVENIVHEKRLEQVNDPVVIDAECRRVYSKMANAVVAQKQRKNGRPLPLLMGQLMKETNGTMNPKMADKLFKELLELPDR